MIPNRFATSSAIIAVMLLTSGCGKDDEKPTAIAPNNPNKKTFAISNNGNNALNKELIEEGVASLTSGEYENANRCFEQALYKDPTNSYLHYVNGIAHQFRGEKGIKSEMEMAQAAFEQAIKFDKENWRAARQLGQVQYAQKHFSESQEAYAHAINYEPRDPKLLLGLATASYYASDLKTAYAAISKAFKLNPEDKNILKARTMILAAGNMQNEAKLTFDSYKKVANPDEVKLIESRLQDWQDVYSSKGIKIAEESDSDSESDSNSTPPPRVMDTTNGASTSQSTTTPISSSGSTQVVIPSADPKKPPMIVLDVTILRVSEDAGADLGYNVLDGKADSSGNFPNPITLIFGKTITNSSGNSVGVFGSDSSSGTSVSKTFVKGLSLTNLSYALNIANSIDGRTEILNRPTLTTLLGGEATFFTGLELATTLRGNFGGSLTRSPIGTTLTVTPISMDGNKVTMKVKINFEFIDNSTTVAIDNSQNYTIIGNSNISTTVESPFDTTVMLAGINELKEQSNKTGFPLLQDIPIIQYAFALSTSLSQKRSLVFMITPRRYEDQPKLVNKYTSNRIQYPDSKPNLEIFLRKNRDWFHAAPNLPEIFSDLHSMYPEFRTGDLDPVTWDEKDALDGVSPGITPFLYF